MTRVTLMASCLPDLQAKRTHLAALAALNAVLVAAAR